MSSFQLSCEVFTFYFTLSQQINMFTRRLLRAIDWHDACNRNALKLLTACKMCNPIPCGPKCLLNQYVIYLFSHLLHLLDCTLFTSHLMMESWGSRKRCIINLSFFFLVACFNKTLLIKCVRSRLLIGSWMCKAFYPAFKNSFQCQLSELPLRIVKHVTSNLTSFPGYSLFLPREKKPVCSFSRGSQNHGSQ